jgi:Thioesterase-like superfamily
MSESLVPTHEWAVPDGWRQGRGAWGGYTITAMAAHVEQLEDPARALRTLSAQIMEPVTVGEYLIEAQCLRQGSAMSTWAVSVMRPHDQVLVAQSQIITGTARQVTISPDMNDWGTAKMPAVTSADMTPIAPVGPPFAPEFTSQLEFRPISPLPTAGNVATSVGWIRLPSRTNAGEHWSGAELMGIIDGWWPASYTLMESMRPMATVAFSVHLLIDPRTIAPVNGERSPLLHEASVSSAFGGFTSELRRLWTPDGRLVAENLQSIVVIK